MSNYALGLIVIIVIIVILVLAALKGSRTRTAERPKAHPYERRRYLLSRAERSFLGILEQAVGRQYRIMAKVRLADVVDVQRRVYGDMRKYAFYRIQSKHLDFVVCNPSTFSVEFAVELDDATHSLADRKDRDDFVDRSLRAAGVPVFRFTAQRAYSVSEIRREIFGEKESGATKMNVEASAAPYSEPAERVPRPRG